VSEVKIPRQWTYAAIPSEIITCEDLSIYAKMMIGAITWHSWDGGKAWPSHETLAKLCSCSSRRIIHAMKELEARGWLQIERQKGRSNRYQFVSKLTTAPQSVVPPTPAQGSVGTAPDAVLPLHHVHTNENKGTIETNQTKDPLFKPFIDWWFEEFEKTFGAKYMMNGRDGLAAKKLLAHIKELSIVQQFVHAAWTSGKVRNDRYLSSQVKTIHGLVHVVNQVMPLVSIGKTEDKWTKLGKAVTG
jgi:hypothetical protein